MMLDKEGSSSPSVTLLSAGGGTQVTVAKRGSHVEAIGDDRVLLSLRLDASEQRLELVGATGDAATDARALSAVAEALFDWHPQLTRFEFVPGQAAAVTQRALRSGLVQAEAQALFLRPEGLMQQRGNWLADADMAPYPLDYAMSEGRRHPRRPPQPDGTLYVRHIPWLDQAIAFRVLTLDDLALFHRWMNDPRVASFWNEDGTIDAHRAYLSDRLADPHVVPLIGSFDDKPFGYFEIYWAKENRIAPFYDVDDYDRGWHVAVGEDAFRGRAYISAWLPSLMHYLFLDDPRTGRIVGEPAVSHVQQIRNLEVSGFAKLTTFDFPHKRAALMLLLRERFFGDRLWLPALPNRSEDAR